MSCLVSKTCHCVTHCALSVPPIKHGIIRKRFGGGILLGQVFDQHVALFQIHFYYSAYEHHGNNNNNTPNCSQARGNPRARTRSVPPGQTTARVPLVAIGRLRATHWTTSYHHPNALTALLRCRRRGVVGHGGGHSRTRMPMSISKGAEASGFFFKSCVDSEHFSITLD